MKEGWQQVFELSSFCAVSFDDAAYEIQALG
jgi:hypothetical protein